MEREELTHRIAPSSTTTSWTSLVFPGLRLDVSSSVHEVTVALQERLAAHTLGLSVAKPESLTAKGIIEKRRECHANDFAIPAELHWIRSRPYWGALEGQVLKLTDGASYASVDYAYRSIKYVLSQDTIFDRHFFARTFLLLPIVELLRTVGLYYTHAGCLKKENRTILLLGEGGTGKSTLSASLLKRGWKLISDDNVLLFRTGSQIHAMAFEQELSLSPDTFAALGFPFETKWDRGKLRVSKNAIPPIFLANKGMVTDIFLLRRGGEINKCPAKASDVLHNLLTENPLVLANPTLSSLHTNLLTSLLRQAQMWNLGLTTIGPQELSTYSKEMERTISS